MNISEELKGKNGVEVFSSELVKSIEEANQSRTNELFDVLINSALSKSNIIIVIKKSLDRIERNNSSLYERIRIYDRLIKWSEINRRNLLKTDLEIRKIETLILLSKYTEAIELISSTNKKLKRTDDKLGLVKLYYLESKVFYLLKNLSKAKSSLTISKSTATFIFCPVLLQAKIDLLSSIYAADEKEYSISSNYIIEAIDGFTLSNETGLSILSIRYLILIKILDNKSAEIDSIIDRYKIKRNKIGRASQAGDGSNRSGSGPNGSINGVSEPSNRLGSSSSGSVNGSDRLSTGSSKSDRMVTDRVIDLLVSISEYVMDRDINKCKELIDSNLELIREDDFLISHLRILCDNLVDANILKIIEAYSSIDIKYIGDRLNFSLEIIEDRIRRMILDEKIKGEIDQETMSINIYRENTGSNHRVEAEEILNVLEDTIETIVK